MKILNSIVFVLMCFITINTIAQNLSPLHSCCDDGDATTFGLNDTISVKNFKKCDIDIHVTCRDCVDRTKNGQLCAGSAGSKYCLDGTARYYALDHPIIVSPLSLSFTAPYGYGCSNPAPQTFSVSNGIWQYIDPTLNWSATKTQNWLSVSPSSGTISGTTPVTITVSVNTAGLAAGIYQVCSGKQST